MPKVMVSRWRRNKPVYLSSPVKVRAPDVEQTSHLDDVLIPVSANIKCLKMYCQYQMIWSWSNNKNEDRVRLVKLKFAIRYKQ